MASQLKVVDHTATTGYRLGFTQRGEMNFSSSTAPVVFDKRHDDSMRNLIQEVRAMRAEFGRVATLLEKAFDDTGHQEAYEVACSEEELKAGVKGYFEDHDGETIYPDDVSEHLRIPLLKAIELCQALEKEGEIGRG